MLFNIYWKELFYLASIDECDFAEDTFHAEGLNLIRLLQRWEYGAPSAIQWFPYKYTKLNEDKFHFLVSSQKLVIQKFGKTNAKNLSE